MSSSCRLSETDVALTQVVSQMSAPNLLTVAEDLMQSRRMTIEDLIESNEVLINFNMFPYTQICMYACFCYAILHFGLIELNLMKFLLSFFS